MQERGEQVAKSLADQLAARGLVTERQIVEHCAQIEIDQVATKKSKTSSVAQTSIGTLWHELDKTPTMSEFRSVAHAILLQDDGAIHRVISKAHRFKDETKEENKKFVWFFYALRDSLRSMGADRHDIVLRRAFRRHQPDPVTRDDMQE